MKTTLKMSLVLGAVALFGLALNASAVLVNVSPGTIALASQSSDIGFPAANALNRNYGDFTHTAAEATDNWWRLDLGGPVPVERVVLFNRTSCCGERLRDITIGFYDTNNVLIANSPLLNPGNALGSPASIAYTNATPLKARFVQVTRKATGGAGDHAANTLSLAEVEIYADNIARGQPATQSTSYGGGTYPAANAVNGNPGDFTHTDAEATDNWLQVDLGANYEVNSVLMLNRGDGCCGERLRDITVSVLDASLATVYSSPLLNPANVLGAPKSLSVDIRFLNGGPLLGRYVRVTRTATGGAGDHAANVLALGELQVYGNVPSGVPPGISTQPQNQYGVVGGSATFTVAAVGSAPLAYQWIKNGSTVLADQTNASLTLANLTLADAGSYSVNITNAFGSNSSSSASLTVFVWNAARAGSASQSTTDNGGVASRAIDGNTDGNWGAGSVTHTGNTPIDNEWWEVDLGTLTYVDRIHVWFRTDCCTTRNENLRLVIYDSAGPGRQILWTQNVGANPGSNKGFDVSPAQLGRVVRVEHPTGIMDVLSLAEVQAFEGPHGTNLLWVGGNPDSSWDTTNTFNWDAGAGPELFHPRDMVTFDNNSSETSVTLIGALAPKTVNVSGDQTYVFQGSGQILGNSLVKSGDGTLVLAGAATHSFNLGALISQGTLQIGNGGTTGTLPTGPLTNNATVVIDRGDDLTVSGGMTGSGVLRKHGANTVTISGASGQGGGTIVAGGTLRLQNNAALGNTATAITTVSNGATLDLGSSELWDYAQPLVINGSGVGGAGAIVKSAPGVGSLLQIRSLTLDSDAALGGVATARIDIGRGDWPGPVPFGPIHLDGQGHTLSLVGDLYLGILAGAQNLAGVVVNSGTLLAPHNDNSLAGATVTLNGGTLTPWGPDHYFANPLVVNSGFIDNQAFFHTYTGPVQVNGPLQVNAIFGGNITFGGTLSGAGAVRKIGAYSVFLGGDNSGFTGSYTNDESNTFFTSDNSGSAAAAWTVNTGILAGYQAGTRTIQLGSLGGAGGIVANNLANPDTGALTFIIGSNHASTVFSGQILDTVSEAGTVAIAKAGAGTLTLAGNNSYSGGTLVQSGTLRYDGTLTAGAGVVAVQGGTLAGNGSLNTPVQIEAAGTLAPGASIGVLTMSSSLVLAGTVVMEIDKSSLTNDLVRGLSSVSYGGTLVVTNLGGTLGSGDSFKLFDAASYGGGFASVQLPALPPGLVWDTTRLVIDGTLNVQRSPSATNMSLGASQNHPAALLIAKMLAHGSDPDGDPLTLASVSNSTNGAMVAIVGPAVVYTPVTNFVGLDQFSYTISDGRGGTATAQVNVEVYPGNVAGLNIVSIQPVAGGIEFIFAGIPGRTYGIERAPTVTGAWTNIANVMANPAGLTSFVDTNAPPGQAFYRTVYP